MLNIELVHFLQIFIQKTWNIYILKKIIVYFFRVYVVMYVCMCKFEYAIFQFKCLNKNVKQQLVI